MTDPSPSPTPVGTLLRVSVTAGDRRVDLGVPGNVAAAEIVPGLARTLGVLDAASVYGGYRLVRADGEPVDSARSLLAAGVEDGAVLTLESGARRPEVRVYDDVVEAVADAVESQYQPWTSRDSALGAAWGAVALVLVAAALLVGADPAAAMPPVVAAAGAVLALACGAVVGRVGREPATGRILVLAAAVLGGVAGLTVGSSAPGWGWPAVWAGVGLVGAGLVGMPALVDRRELAAGPVVLGLALAVSGATVALTDAAAGEVLAVVVAIVVTASIGVPWLALSSTPLRVVSARTEAEILLDPPPVDPERVRRQLESGHRLQVSLRVAVGLFALAATPAVVALGVVGTVLLLVGFAGVLLSSRQSYSRLDVLLVVSAGIVGMAATVFEAAVLHPSWRGALVALAGAGAAVVVGIGLVAPRQRVGLARVGDVLEVTCLAVLLPLGVAAAGLV
ncbi:type VII secretion integral membrane protein EccD [Cellulomonas sp. P5_E12]